MFNRLMKRTWAIVVAAIAAHAGNAYAVPFAWFDEYDPADITVSSQLDFTHDIRDGAFGFRPGIDTISSATLSVVLADDALFGDLPLLGDSQEFVSFNFDGTGWTAPQSVDLLDVFTFQFDTLLMDGVLGISVRATQGDFKFAKSTLVAIGNRAAVPEPASPALFGLGLFGLLACVSRRLRANARG